MMAMVAPMMVVNRHKYREAAAEGHGDKKAQNYLFHHLSPNMSR
jgi:hypothetical protein